MSDFNDLSRKTYYDISEITYDGPRQRLYVKIRKRIYQFEDVPEETFLEFQGTSDKSSYFEMLKRSFIQFRDF